MFFPGGRKGGPCMTGRRRMGPDVLPWQAESWPGPHSRKRNGLQIQNLDTSGRTSGPIFTRRRKCRGTMGCQGSLTVETALVLPLFWYFFSCFLCLFLLFRLHQDIGQALADAGREMGQYAGDGGEGALTEQGFGLWSTRQKIKEKCRDKAALDFVEGGIAGISLAKSRILKEDARIELVAEYRFKLPWLFPGLKHVQVVQSQVCRAWVGYTGETGGQKKEPYVYITPYGTVYHQSMDCKYLTLSVRTTPAGTQDEMRNRDGERYQACESCCSQGKSGIVYVTDYGNRYHQSLSCPGLKRSVYLVPLSETTGRGACGGCS